MFDMAALLQRLYEEHPAPERSDQWVAHERGRCPKICWEWISIRLKEEVLEHMEVVRVGNAVVEAVQEQSE